MFRPFDKINELKMRWYEWNLQTAKDNYEEWLHDYKKYQKKIRRLKKKM